MDFIKASIASFEPEKNISIDEQLILFKGVILIVPILIMRFILVRQEKREGKKYKREIELKNVVKSIFF